MYKETRTYTDYDGNQRTEDFYFNLNRAECLEMQMSKDGGMLQFLNRIIAAQDMPTIMDTFKKIIRKAYGEKSPDGKKFIKSEELSDAFEQTEAYSDLFVELTTDSKKAAEFVNSIIPNEKIIVPANNQPTTPQNNIAAMPTNQNQ